MTPANVASRVEDVLAERTKHDEVIAWRATGVRSSDVTTRYAPTW